MVLFPPVMLVFFLGGVATPLAALLFLVASPNVAWLYVTTAMAYFLHVQWLHFAYHPIRARASARCPACARSVATTRATTTHAS